MSDEKKYGQPISLSDAAEMHDEYKLLNDNVQMILSPSIAQTLDTDLKAKEEIFIDQRKKVDAYAFSMDLISRFWDGSEKNVNGEAQKADYLLVILGAHKNDKVVNGEQFEAGSFTVITAGCTRKEVLENGKPIIKFFPLPIKQPGTEYPPSTRVSLKSKKGHDINGNDIDYFEVV